MTLSATKKHVSEISKIYFFSSSLLKIYDAGCDEVNEDDDIVYCDIANKTFKYDNKKLANSSRFSLKSLSLR